MPSINLPAKPNILHTKGCNLAQFSMTQLDFSFPIDGMHACLEKGILTIC